MPTEPRAYPTIQRVVDEIFARCTLRYGRDFLARWAGQKLSAVKADWCRELRGLERPERRHALDHALDNLPSEPPRADQFKALASRAPERAEVLAALNAPVAKPEVIAAVVAKAAAVGRPQGDLLTGQRADMVREVSGEYLPMARRQFWRTALRMEVLRLYGMDTTDKRLDLKELGRRIAAKASREITHA